MRFSKSVLIAVAAAILLCSCSSGNDDEKKKGKIEAMTEQAGQEAVRAIKTPIEKAQTVADKEAQRAKEMEERNQE